ncbi:carboxypeptidase regulatory-like domain-containing protein [candidate division CSSED10-310 bacterium]|uniref:Carboxypeptidase regulatory-like domain-containing protein n=1 Tax=candidate division CSSED10-310 bacterium TaxID=2855610 RepID=A0ABV6YVG6_UNCC1
MGNKFRMFSLCLFVLLVFLGSQVFAAETGSIIGKVVDKTEMPLPGVTITATSISLIGARNATTNEDGRFRLPILPVGVYTLAFDLTGYRPLKFEKVTVKLGVDTVAEASLELSEEIKEEIVVVADIVPLVDSKTANVATYVDSKQLDTIPSDRSFRDVTKFDPGITGVRFNSGDGTAGDGLPSIRGEGEYGNNYLIDGLSVRDPKTYGTGTPLNFSAIDEIQIISDGFNPEYGQALGGTINVVTKSGGNNFSGEVAWQYKSDAMSQDEADALWSTEKEYTDSHPYLNIGGPIIKDRLWFFTAYEKTMYDETVAAKSVTDPETNQIVDEIASGGNEDDRNNFFLKLSLQINPNNIVSLSGTMYNSEIAGQGTDELRKPDARHTQLTDQLRLRVNYKSILTDTTVLEFKAGMIQRDLDDQGDLGNRGPAEYTNQDTGVYWHNYDNLDNNERDRQDVLLQATHYLEAGGSHELKAGVGYYWANSARTIEFNGLDEDLYPGDTFDGGTRYQFVNNEIDPTYAAVPTLYYEHRSIDIANETSGMSFFIQDTYSPMENLNIMLGVRFDTQDVQNNDKQTLLYFSADESISPRLTATWDITSDSKNIAKIGYGRFFDITSTGLASWGNTASPYAYRMYAWAGPTGDEWNNMSEEERDAALHNGDNWGDGRGNTGADHPRREQSGESNPLYYDPDLRPPYKDEFLVEYDRKLTERYVAKIRYINSHTRDLIEDVAYWKEPGSLEQLWVIENWDEKKRDYYSLEVEFNGHPTDNISFYLSYCNSEAKGTNPGQFELAGFQSQWGSGNDVGVFGDHLPHMWWGEGLGGPKDGNEGWYGYLPYSVDHQIKFRGFWRAPYGITIGTSLEWNSGYHWSRRGYSDGYGDYFTFPDGRGNREMPSIYYWDASLEKAFTFGDRYGLGIKLDIFNLTNSDTAVAYVNQDTDNFGKTLEVQEPMSVRITASFTF